MQIRGLAQTVLVACISTTAWAANSHCQKQEVEVFNCAVAQKTLSVCASADYSSKHGYLQYRFGVAGKPELTLPRDRWRGAATEARAETFGNGGQTGYLRFWNGPTAYVVFHGNLRSGSDWKDTAGVAVENRGKRTALLQCAGAPSSKLLDARYLRDTLGFMDNSEAPGFDFP
jgi:hypothetical protein